MIIGLMSGTSMDGVDAVACDISIRAGQPSIRIVAGARTEYPEKLKTSLMELCRPGGGSTQSICALNVEVGDIFAKTAIKLMKSPQLANTDIRLIGSHGQTVFHLPSRCASLQIGDPAVISARTGINTWFGFRQADLAGGGEGAPLAPVVHPALFGEKDKDVAVVNIGGIANFTYIPAGERRLTKLKAWDTGPGAILLDMTARKMGIGRFDKDGKVAGQGKVKPAMLKRMLAHPYFRRKPPKSAGREIFGDLFAEKWAELSSPAQWDRDVMATLAELTARTIVDDLKKIRKGKKKAGRIVVCGGGAKNLYLVERLSALARPDYDVTTSDRLGAPSWLVEPTLVALLAFHANRGDKLDLSAITGAKRPALIGMMAPTARSRHRGG